jgi:hypothetical protein
MPQLASRIEAGNVFDWSADSLRLDWGDSLECSEARLSPLCPLALSMEPAGAALDLIERINPVLAVMDIHLGSARHGFPLSFSLGLWPSLWHLVLRAPTTLCRKVRSGSENRLMTYCRTRQSYVVHPFTAPDVRPATIWRLKSKYTRSGGMVISRMFIKSRL